MKMNVTLLRKIVNKEVVVWRGKPLPVIKQVEFRGESHDLLGKNTRNGRACFFLHSKGIFTTVDYSFITAHDISKIKKVPKASKNMPSVLSIEEHEKIVNAFMKTLDKEVIPFSFKVALAKSANKGCAYTRDFIIQFPSLLSNDIASHGGFLEYSSTIPTWKSLGFGTKRIGKNVAITYDYLDNTDMVLFGVWAFLVHELSHLRHRFNIAYNNEYCKESHGFGFCRALEEILLTTSYSKFKEKYYG